MQKWERCGCPHVALRAAAAQPARIHSCRAEGCSIRQKNGQQFAAQQVRQKTGQAAPLSAPLPTATLRPLACRARCVGTTKPQTSFWTSATNVCIAPRWVPSAGVQERSCLPCNRALVKVAPGAAQFVVLPASKLYALCQPPATLAPLPPVPACRAASSS